jgi:hypothetical protein
MGNTLLRIESQLEACKSRTGERWVTDIFEPSPSFLRLAWIPPDRLQILYSLQDVGHYNCLKQNAMTRETTQRTIPEWSVLLLCRLCQSLKGGTSIRRFVTRRRTPLPFRRRAELSPLGYAQGFDVGMMQE